MNYWEHSTIDIQEFEITPRSFAGLDSTPFTSDTTLYTADTTLYTADATVIGGTQSEITITYEKDGSFTPETVTATAVLNNSILTVSAVIDADEKSFYYFKVFANGNEIYRGKSFTFDILPDEPLHYSIYD